jgi:CysZ protein
MFAAARKAAGVLFEPALFRVALKSLLLTLALFAILFVVAQVGVQHLPVLRWPWLNLFVDAAASVLVIGLALFLGAPVAAIFASLFLGQIASAVEKKYYPADAQAAGAPVSTYLLVGLRFAAWLIVVSVALLPFDVMLPGLGSLASLSVNGWLLGREYFELVGLRHHPRATVDEMRRRHALGILGAGLVIAVLAAIPIVDFIAPLFGAAFMVHVFKHYEHRESAV